MEYLRDYPLPYIEDDRKHHTTILDDVITVVHWILLPGIISLILYFELDDDAEKWVKDFQISNKTLPSGLPSGGTIITLTVISLFLYGISAFMLWRCEGGHFRRYLVALSVWELTVISYFLGWGLFFTTSEEAGTAAIAISMGLALLNFCFFINYDKKGAMIQVVFITWTIFVFVCGIRIVNAK